MTIIASEIRNLIEFMTPGEREEFANLIAASHKFTLYDLYIQTKGDEFSPPEVIEFSPNNIQRAYLDMVSPKWRDGTIDLAGCREIILKARQEGFSTLIEAMIFLVTVNTPNIKAALVAHDGDSAEILFEMMRRFYEYLPDGPKKPRTSYANKRELVFPDLNSSIRVLTAGTKTSGRGRTIHLLHCSEFAFWQYPEAVTSLFQAVPMNGAIFIESTANGVGNRFHTDYIRAKKNITRFKARFFPWWKHHEYRLDPPQGFKLTPEEEERCKLYNLDHNQIAWERVKREELGIYFDQEYPENDQVAFLVSGETFFSQYKESDHYVRAVFTPQENPPFWYDAIGGLDWGYADPFAFCMGVVDERGDVHCLQSFEKTRLLNEQQAEMIILALERWGIEPERFALVCDASMWSHKTVNGKKAEPDIAAFQRMGLRCIPGANDIKSIQHRNSQIRHHLSVPGKIRFYQGYNGRMVECVQGATHDPLKREMVKHDQFSHLCVALGNMLSMRPRPSESPAEDDTILIYKGKEIVPVKNLPEPFIDRSLVQADAGFEMMWDCGNTGEV